MRQSCAEAYIMLDGPMRANSPNITGHEMGSCEGVEHKSFQAAVGQLDLISKAMTSSLRANATTLVGTYPRSLYIMKAHAAVSCSSPCCV